MLGIVILSVLVAIAVAGLCGLLNGVLVAKVRIPPILATLGTMKLYEGLSLVITRGSPITSFPKPFLFIGSGSVLHVPFPLIVFVLCAIAVSVFLSKTPLGFSIYAVGENPTAARFSGLRNERMLMKTYLVTGLLVGVAAVLMIARVDSVKVGYGNSYLLQAVLVVILGGVSDAGRQRNRPGGDLRHPDPPDDLQRFQHHRFQQPLPQRHLGLDARPGDDREQCGAGDRRSAEGGEAARLILEHLRRGGYRDSVRQETGLGHRRRAGDRARKSPLLLHKLGAKAGGFRPHPGRPGGAEEGDRLRDGQSSTCWTRKPRRRPPGRCCPSTCW